MALGSGGSRKVDGRGCSVSRRPRRLRRLQHVIVDEPGHGRAALRGAPRSEDLHVEIFEELARIAIGQAGRLGSCAAPGPDLLNGAVGLMPWIALGQVEAVEINAFGIELPEQIVEGAVLEHEHDNMFNSLHLLTIGFTELTRRRPAANVISPRKFLDRRLPRAARRTCPAPYSEDVRARPALTGQSRRRHKPRLLSVRA